MWTYIFKRLLLLIPTLLGILALTFAIIQFVPGGPVEQMVQQLNHGSQNMAEVSSAGGLHGGRQGLSAEEIDKLKVLYGFDKPPLTRFIDMVGQYMRFDLGDSFFQPKSVMALVVEKLPVSMSLGLWTFFLTYLICIPLGIAKAVRDGSRFDAISSLLILIGYAIPGFVLGILLLILFGGGSFWSLFPLGGMVSDDWAT